MDVFTFGAVVCLTLLCTKLGLSYINRGTREWKNKICLLSYSVDPIGMEQNQRRLYFQMMSQVCSSNSGIILAEEEGHKTNMLRSQPARLLLRGFCSTMKPFSLEKLDGNDQGIAVFKMNVPKTKNAISKAFLQGLQESLQEVKFDKDVRVVILKSEVNGTFCTGADLKERKTMTVEDVPKFVDSLRTAFSEIERLPQPVIAAIDGFALGGGFEMALACDIRLSTPASKIGLTETKLAIIPAAGGTQRLVRTVGPAVAKELIFTARVVTGAEAEKLGIVNQCVENSYDKALEIARQIKERGPIAIRMAKIAIDTGSQMDLSSGLIVEQQCYAQIIPTKDRVEGLTAFAEKRSPNYSGS